MFREALKNVKNYERKKSKGIISKIDLTNEHYK